MKKLPGLTVTEQVVLNLDLKQLSSMIKTVCVVLEKRKRYGSRIAKHGRKAVRQIETLHKKLIPVPLDSIYEYYNIDPVSAQERPIPQLSIQYAESAKELFTIEEHREIGRYLNEAIDIVEPRGNSILCLSNRIGLAYGARFCDAALAIERQMRYLRRALSDEASDQYRNDFSYRSVYSKDRY